MEALFNERIARSLGLSQEQLEDIYDNIEEYKFIPEKDELSRLTLFQRMVMLICMDQDLHEEELKNIKVIGLNIGLNPNLIQQYLLELQKFNYWQGKLPNVMKVFKVTHN